MATIALAAFGSKWSRILPALGALGALLASSPAHAQEREAPSAVEVAQQLSNPVASLVVVPLQFNWDQPVGVDDDTRMIMNFQPVVPLSLSEDWNLIGRWIMPFVSQPRLGPGAGPVFGLGDIVASMFISPTEPGSVVWGVGPVFLLPSTSDPLLGTGKWAVGPTAVVLRVSGGFTYGFLANHLWSFAGGDSTGGVPRSDVNSTLLQPFLSYTTANAVTFTVNSEATANWEAEHEWTIPVHFQISKLTEFGPIPFSVTGGVGVFLTAPNDQPEWRLRTVFSLILPRG